MRTGHLIRDRIYLTVKNVRPGKDEHYVAPAGTPLTWDPEKHKARYAELYPHLEYTGTNSGHEDSYGGRFLYWVDLVDYGSIGAELGVDFEWDDTEPMDAGKD